MAKGKGKVGQDYFSVEEAEAIGKSLLQRVQDAKAILSVHAKGKTVVLEAKRGGSDDWIFAEGLVDPDEVTPSKVVCLLCIDNAFTPMLRNMVGREENIADYTVENNKKLERAWNSINGLGVSKGANTLTRHLDGKHNHASHVMQKRKAAMDGNADAILETWMTKPDASLSDRQKKLMLNKALAKLGIRNSLSDRVLHSPEMVDVIQLSAKLGLTDASGLDPVDMRKNCNLLHASFIAMVKLVVKAVQAAHSYGGDEFVSAWLTILHDGWSKGLLAALGISLCFIDPDTWDIVKIAVSLFDPDSHSAADSAHAIQIVLRLLGLPVNCVLASVNDTASTAVATAKLITNGETGTCTMHKGNLVLNFALGSSERTNKDGDYGTKNPPWKEGKNYHKQLRDLQTHVFTTTAGARLIRVKDANVDTTILHVGPDNDTRVAGTQRMTGELMRSLFVIRRFGASEVTLSEFGANKKLREDAARTAKVMPSRVLWRCMAGVHTISGPMVDFAFDTQIDVTVTVAMECLHLWKVWNDTIIDVQTVVDTETKLADAWAPQTQVQHLPTKKVSMHYANGDEDDDDFAADGGEGTNFQRVDGFVMDYQVRLNNEFGTRFGIAQVRIYIIY